MQLERKYPLAPSQQIFWALHEIFPDTSTGNEAVDFRLRGPLQREALLRSCQELAQHFDVWRTAFSRDEATASGEPVAIVREMALRVDEIDLSEVPEAEREAELTKLLQERARARFDLSRPPLVRVLLARLGAEDHVLQFVSHHVILDGISMLQVLPRALSECYSRFIRAEPLPAPPPTYADFAEAQRLAFSASERETLKFWKQTLARAQTALDLPCDRRRGKQRSSGGARLTHFISPEQRERLSARAATLGASLPDLLLCAFAVQLQRYSRQHELVIGVANGNRRDPSRRDMFGCLVITVPVICNLSGNPSLRELAQRLRTSKRAAFAHLDPGVDEVMSELGGASDGRRGSSYQTVFNYMNFALSDTRFEGLSVEAKRSDPGWTAVDLSMDVNEDRGGLVCTLEYATELFEARSAQRYLKHYATLLDSIAHSDFSAQPIGELSLMDAQEQRTVLREFNATDARFPADRCLHEIIRERAVAAAGATAISNGQRELRYSELLERATIMADQLRALGAAPGKRVALMIKDPLEAVVAMLGVLEAGAAYVPIDPTLPSERLEWMLSASQPTAIVTERASLDALPPFRSATLCVEDPPDARLRAQPGTTAAASPSDPAYLIFTSGSTGRPKGVVVTHRNVVNQLYARIGYYPEGPTRMLMPHSVSFDAAVGALYWTLFSGGLLLLPDADTRRDPAGLRRLIARHGATHADLVPSMYEEMLSGDPGAELQSLRTIILGGEACSARLAARHFEVLPETALYNEYGPTETTVYSTVYQLRASLIPDPVPIGRAIANTRCYVLDEHRKLSPLGVPGELYIGGDGVTQGYFNDRERTQERFVPDPFAIQSHARMYRTGDLVRLREDGDIEYLGRVDRQIKVRGYRIELGEIEAALGRCPGVSRAVAVPRNDALGAHIDAYVTAKHKKKPPAPAELRGALRKELPAYMVPSHLQVVDEIPHTPSGKIDIDRLPKPAPGDAEDEGRREHYVEPRTQTEQTLSQIWSELLGRPRVGMRDDFFDMGGHSLLAVRMLSLVQARFGGHVSLSAFFQGATIAQLAGLLHQESGLKEESLIVPIQTGDRPPFWLPHPVGGHVVFARRLAVHLDPEQPLMGIQAQGLDGQREPLRTIEQMAERYIELIREVQPNGPYFVGGHSLGGLIAFEIAQRLRAAGEPVGMLALFDTPGPNYPRKTSLFVRLRDHVQLRAHRLRLWLERMESDEVPANEVEEYLSYDPLKGEQRRGALMDAIDRVTHFNEMAANNYRPRPYPGVVHVFRATQVPHWPGMRFDDRSCGWAPYAQQVETFSVDCTHQNMMDEPGVSELGAKLQDRLLRCQQQSARAANARSRARKARDAVRGSGSGGPQSSAPPEQLPPVVASKLVPHQLGPDRTRDAGRDVELEGDVRGEGG